MSRAARAHRVFFIEEPVFDEAPPGEERSWLQTDVTPEGVIVCVPHLPRGLDPAVQDASVRNLVDQLVRDRGVSAPLCWFYSPMMLPLADHLTPSRVVYDCMDELSAFVGAPPALRHRERELLARADVVFTGGQSLFLAKRPLHPHVFAFPSSVDAAHFGQAATAVEPADQKDLPHPRIGFFGVIDERLDVALIRSLAESRPTWQIVMVGPVVKIDPGILPKAPNVHWMGGRSYAELPAYLGGWDVAILPFALNEATRFISPTKTLEYLAAGKPVVSTAITDVVDPYGKKGLARIADATTFVSAIEDALREPFPAGRRAVSETIAQTSWDRTWGAMHQLVLASAIARPQKEAGGFASTDSLPHPSSAGGSVERNTDR